MMGSPLPSVTVPTIPENWAKAVADTHSANNRDSNLAFFILFLLKICLSCDCFFESVGKDIIKNAYVNTRIDKKWII